MCRLHLPPQLPPPRERRRLCCSTAALLPPPLRCPSRSHAASASPTSLAAKRREKGGNR
ncbi:unnamed protein product [Linum tenue]|uniref:Uncharacterized protein n=1 Tax=Linum tenue TaxID=586396 RepID=A0AAV0KB07_9ROSI|nr:unnamed protein product [Linum tenue]